MPPRMQPERQTPSESCRAGEMAQRFPAVLLRTFSVAQLWSLTLIGTSSRCTDTHDAQRDISAQDEGL